MDSETGNLKQRILESKIFNPTQLDRLVEKYELSVAKADQSSESLAHWLSQQQLLSEFQCQVLLTEQHPRLKYGNYILVDCISVEDGIYLGKHQLTNHPVRLRFYSGEDQQSLAAWRLASEVCQKISESSHSTICEFYEPVAISEYRFVVTEIPKGKDLQRLVPLKSRLPKDDANKIIVQIASGLKHLQELGLREHFAIEPTVKVAKGGRLKIDYLLAGQTEADCPAADQLVNLWFRITTGRTLKSWGSKSTFSEEDIARLNKNSVDDALIDWLTQNKPWRNDDFYAQLILRLQKQNSADVTNDSTKETYVQYVQWLDASLQIGQPIDVGSVSPKIETAEPEVEKIPNGEIAPLGLSQSSGTQDRVKPKRPMLIPLVGSFLTVASVVGIVIALTAGQTQSVPVAGDTVGPKEENGEAVEPSDLATVEPLPFGEDALVSSYVDQTLISDDETTLWESPTLDRPLNFQAIPNAPKIAIAIRLKDWLGSNEGNRIIQSLGPEINANLTQLETRLKIPLNEIQQLLITFHSGEDYSYEPFYRIDLAEPRESATLLKDWDTNVKSVDGVENVQYHYHDQQMCYGIIDEDQGLASKLVFGSERLVSESVAYAAVETTSGIMARLIEQTDRSRHLTILALRSSLFNDAGQKLMGSEQLSLNQLMARSISSVIRGIGVSVHIDNGSFIELQIDHSADQTSDLVVANLKGTVTQTASQLSTYANGLVSNPYWDRVRERVGLLVDDFILHFRWGIEDRKVGGNGWFPEPAAHNWITAGRLLMTYGKYQQRAANSENQIASSTPETLDQLLAQPRDLTVATAPDLIVLINNLQQEVNDDFNSLPFEFEIRLSGADLSKEGITQNQRLGDLNIKQQPLSDILTEIMVKANPDKNISGPEDPACKMVWVVTSDPNDTSRQIILITTRAAAAAQSYKLPAAFVGQD